MDTNNYLLLKSDHATAVNENTISFESIVSSPNDFFGRITYGDVISALNTLNVFEEFERQSAERIETDQDSKVNM